MKKETLDILIIDDSLADFRVAQSFLKQAFPDQVEVCHELAEEGGLAAIRTQKFDCVLLDYLLGEADGLEVLRRIRSERLDVPIVAVSGSGSERVAVEALKLGAQDYLVKGDSSPGSYLRAVTNAISKVAYERQLKEKKRELEAFVHVAAHDLKGPLTTVHQYAQLTLQHDLSHCHQEVREFVERIEAKTSYMRELVSSLLKYAISGRGRDHFQVTQLNDIVESAIGNLEARITARDAQVTRSELPDVMGDRVALIQLFENLISNAIKFCRDSTPDVKLHYRTRGDLNVISITDNGIGISSESLERIFDPFVRLNGKTQFDGTGMGLATCRRIVEQHEGAIEVESELGVGTTFTLVFPSVDLNKVERDRLSLSDEAAASLVEKELVSGN